MHGDDDDMAFFLEMSPRTCRFLLAEGTKLQLGLELETALETENTGTGNCASDTPLCMQRRVASDAYLY